jgi:outer membrane protein, heavy metal efflux system
MQCYRGAPIAFACLMLGISHSALAQSSPTPQGPSHDPVLTLPTLQPSLPPELSTSGAQEAWSLQQLEEQATAQSPVLRRDLARIEAARGIALQAGLYPNPHFDSGNPPFTIAGRNSQFNFGVQQEIVVKGKLKLERAAAERQVKQAQLAYQQNRLALLTAIRHQFYVTVAAKRRVEVQESLLKILSTSLNTAKRLQKVGEASQLDYLLLSVDYRQAETNLLKNRALLEGQYKKLAAIVGVPGLVVQDVLGDLTLTPPVFDESQLREYVTMFHTSIQIAQLAVERDNILLRRAQMEPYPNPYLGPAYTFGVSPGNEQVSINLTFPIPVWNLNQGNIRAAQANIRGSVESLAVLQNELVQRTSDAWSHHMAAQRVFEQHRSQIIPQATQILKLTQAGLKGGVFDFPRYLQAQRSVVEANNSYIDALEGVWTTAVELAGLLQHEHFP